MPEWEAMYQAENTGWDRGGVSPALETWLKQNVLNEGASVLIPGCGRGYEVVHLASLGFDVTAIDIAPSAIRALQGGLAKSNVTANAYCEDIFLFHTENQFDLIYEQTCLCAIEPREREDYEACLAKWLKPGGKLLFSMMQTGSEGGPPYHCDMLEMRSLFEESRWSWLQQPPFVIPRCHQSERFELGFILERKG